jgi:hypothetical protein
MKGLFQGGEFVVVLFIERRALNVSIENFSVVATGSNL